MYVEELSTSPAQRARRDRDSRTPNPGLLQAAIPSPKDASRAWAGTSLLDETRLTGLAQGQNQIQWLGTPIPTTQTSLRQSHFSPSPRRAGRALQLKARHPSSHIHHAYNLPPPTPASQIPRRAEQRCTDRPGGACAIRRGQQWGRRDDAWHSSAFPFHVQALPPSRGEGLLQWEQLCKQQGPSLATGIIQGGKPEGSVLRQCPEPS